MVSIERASEEDLFLGVWNGKLGCMDEDEDFLGFSSGWKLGLRIRGGLGQLC
jgi:hypothetical protein